MTTRMTKNTKSYQEKTNKNGFDDANSTPLDLLYNTKLLWHLYCVQSGSCRNKEIKSACNDV